MGSLQAEGDLKNELNDSGFAQDESMMKKQPSETTSTPDLLDLSDDVLLFILKYCDPRDLKALGFTCSRLGGLVLDRTLWERVDARSYPVGPERLKWYMRNALTPNTTELLLSGYAREAEGCLGHMKCEFKDIDKQEKAVSLAHFVNGTLVHDEPQNRGIIRGGPVIQIYDTMPSFLDAVTGPGQPEDATCVSVLVSSAGHNTVHIRATCFPLADAFVPDSTPDWAPPDSSCPGPQYTITPDLLRELITLCPHMTTLGLEYCNIDCSTRNISNFPRTLKTLSLRGSRCYNQPVDKSFLFKIQDYLTELEELNVSECNWIEPSSLLPLSKLPSLRRLYMRQCCKMTECVAYSSLATRYGFKKLQVIDLRESPVGDSEVSSFGWVATLEELYVSPAPFTPKIIHHAHYVGDDLPFHIELDPWEEEEPEYFKTKADQRPKPVPEPKPEPPKDPQSLKRKIKMPKFTWAERKISEDEVAAKRLRASQGVEEYDSDSMECDMFSFPAAPGAGEVGDGMAAAPGPEVEGSEVVGPGPDGEMGNAEAAEPGPAEEMHIEGVAEPGPAGDMGNAQAAGPGPAGEMGNEAVAEPGPAGENGAADDADPRQAWRLINSENPELHSVGDMRGGEMWRPRQLRAPDGEETDTSDSDDAYDDDTLGQPITVAEALRELIPKPGDENYEELDPVGEGLSDEIILQFPDAENEVAENGAGSAEIPAPDVESMTESGNSEVTDLPGPSNALETGPSEPRPSTSKSPDVVPGPSKSNGLPGQKSDGSEPSSAPGPSNAAGPSNAPGPSNPPGPSNGTRRSPTPGPSNRGADVGRVSFQRYIRFRQNRSPVVVDRPDDSVDGRHHEPLHKILYVNVGRRLHTMYRLTMPVYQEDHDLMGRNGRRFDSPYLTPRYDPRTLVTDSTVHRFGRGDSDNISYINIGPHGIEQENPGARPDRSNLRVLSMAGFRTITNRSLVHLATAAPRLRVIDFTGTRVTERGVANFKALRPDCEVRFDQVL